jgi:lipid II:glycine glycyltransferase (peptidoglycan interpeptide bridge formation enzyme)
VTASTIITSPCEKDPSLYRELLSPRYSEDRTTQMLTIPEADTEHELMKIFEKRCRWAIMKAARNNVLVKALNDFEGGTMDQLYDMHVENAARGGAPAKPRVFFEKIRQFFQIHRDYDVYAAEYKDKLVAGLLVFYFGRFAEYFVPAVKADYRNLNPMNLIVLKAMANAAQRGVRIWNFGGTRESMSGVYIFKRSFGARDYDYHYFTSVVSDPSNLLALTASEMRSGYQWFYVLPYSMLAR